MNFTPVRDPNTGRIDMVPKREAQWGDFARNEDARNIIGKERYDAFYPDDFNGEIKTIEDLHDATIVEITALLAPHASTESVSALAREWVDAATLVRDGTLPMATVAFVADLENEDGHDGKSLIAINITVHEAILTMFCSCGDVLNDPLTYWNDEGAFAIATVEEEAIDDGMVSAQVQLRRWDNTKIAVAAKRKLAEQPAGVVDLNAFRQLRAVAG